MHVIIKLILQLIKIDPLFNRTKCHNFVLSWYLQNVNKRSNNVVQSLVKENITKYLDLEKIVSENSESIFLVIIKWITYRA